MVDIGDASRQSDGRVYKSSRLGHAIDNNTINRPPPSRITGTNKLHPYVFVADDLITSNSYLTFCPYC